MAGLDEEKCPFPWFGGKSKAAPLVWRLLGDPVHFVEPFAGSLAILLNRPHLCNRPYKSETVNDIDGLLCLAPETRVLMADLRWRSIGDVQLGDQLIGFDEENDGSGWQDTAGLRRWRTTAAIATNRVLREAYRLTFEDGTAVIASADHLWLCSNGARWKWIKTASMVCNRETQCSRVLKLCEVLNCEDSYEAGWLGGFLDGEGNIRKNPGWCVTASQKVGPEAERFEHLLCARGYEVSAITGSQNDANPKHQDVVAFKINGGMRETLRLLMRLRPERLIRTVVESISNHTLYGRSRQSVDLVCKEYLGQMELVALETTTHTYIAEGLASHNCNAWRSIQWHPEETARHASWPVSECDKQSRQIAVLRWRTDKVLDLLAGSPEWCDPKMAGWWLYGVCCQIGGIDGPWTADPATGRIVKQGRGTRRDRLHLSNNGRGVNHAGTREPGVNRDLPHISDDGQGVNHAGTREPGVNRDRPHLGDNGRGVNHAGTREPGVFRDLPHLSNDGRGVNHAGTREPGVLSDEPDNEFHAHTMPRLICWFQLLSARLRHVRILNGDWSRLVTTGAAWTLPVRQGDGPCGVFLDPPYDTAERARGLYGHDVDGLAADVRKWCLKNGDSPKFRIVLAGYDTEHVALLAAGWTVHEWYEQGHLTGGYGNIARGTGNGDHQQKRERIWASPFCLPPVGRGLFDLEPDEAAPEPQPSLFSDEE